MRGIYAIGDVTGEPMLAHRAMAQGEMVAEIIAGKKRAWDKRCIPAICFTDPEIVSAGLSAVDARAQGYEIRIGQFPFSANGRAMTMVSELSAAFALAIEMGARLEDIAGTIHAHPTRSEAVMEAALKALGSALHI
jgi:dihydrolipoamide dehydrogenase